MLIYSNHIKIHLGNIKKLIFVLYHPTIVWRCRLIQVLRGARRCFLIFGIKERLPSSLTQQVKTFNSFPIFSVFSLSLFVFVSIPVIWSHYWQRAEQDRNCCHNPPNYLIDNRSVFGLSKADRVTQNYKHLNQSWLENHSSEIKHDLV